MKPKEKAQELVCKMYGCEINTDLNDIYILNADGYFIAKKHALICINEIIDFRKKLYFTNHNSSGHKYLLEIKTEIENL